MERTKKRQVVLAALTAVFGSLAVGAWREYNAPAKLEIVNAKEEEFGSGVKTRTWNLEGRKVRELHVRLMRFEQGAALPQEDIECHWDKPPRTLHGQITLLKQTGEPFGIKDKVAEGLTVSFPTAPPPTMSTFTASFPLAPPARSSSVRATTKGALSGDDAIYVEETGYLSGQTARRYEPRQSDEETAKLTAGNDARIVAVVVDWKP